MNGFPSRCLTAGAALLLSACSASRPAAPAPPPLPPAAAALLLAAQRPSVIEANARRRDLLAEAAGGGKDILQAVLRKDDYGGPLQAGEAIEAYAAGEELKALLLAQAAVGADPGSGPRRRLLEAIERKTGMKADPQGLLPLKALVHLELRRADEEFFAERFGAAIQACRRALLLAPEDHEAWMRLGSAHFALGEQDRAKTAYLRARELDPKDAYLLRFMQDHGWLEK